MHRMTWKRFIAALVLFAMAAQRTGAQEPAANRGILVSIDISGSLGRAYVSEQAHADVREALRSLLIDGWPGRPSANRNLKPPAESMTNLEAPLWRAGAFFSVVLFGSSVYEILPATAATPSKDLIERVYPSHFPDLLTDLAAIEEYAEIERGAAQSSGKDFYWVLISDEIAELGGKTKIRKAGPPGQMGKPMWATLARMEVDGHGTYLGRPSKIRLIVRRPTARVGAIPKAPSRIGNLERDHPPQDAARILRLEEALQADPESAILHFLLGECHRASAADDPRALRKAIRSFERALRIAPAHVGASLGAARLQLRQGNPREAMAKLQPLAREHLATPSLLLLKAQIHAELGEKNQGLRLAMQVIDLNYPAEVVAEAHFLAASLFPQGSRGLELQIRHYTMAIGFAPTMAKAHLFRGLALKLRGMTEAASADFEKAVQIDPSSRWAALAKAYDPEVEGHR